MTAGGRAAVVALVAFATSAPPLTSTWATTQSVLEPRTTFDGPALTFDLPGLQIGVAEYDEGPTGVTAFLFPDRALVVTDVRGGAPGTVNTDALRLGYADRSMRAVVFAGGSWHGLSAVNGVADALRASTGADVPRDLVGVTGAILNDVSGGRRLSGIMPDARLGAVAVATARSGWFPLGARGAGRFAMMGGGLGQLEPAGQGAAVRRVGAATIGVFTVVNASGFIVDRAGRIARCRSAQFGEPCSRITDLLARRTAARLLTTAPADAADMDDAADGGGTANTTLTLVATDLALSPASLQRLAVQVHTSLSRAIQPFGTAADGDVLFVASTGRVAADIPMFQVGLVASELAWDAVLTALPPAPTAAPMGGASSVLPGAQNDASGVAGRFDFGPGTVVDVRVDASGLATAKAPRSGIVYFEGVEPTTLAPVGPRAFRLGTPRRDLVVFDGDTMIINPGPWAVAGRRLSARPR